MTKSIVLSIKSQHAYNIMTKKKTLELRKRVPKGFKGWVYVYVTKGKPLLYDGIKTYLGHGDYYEDSWILNGTIPFRFWFDEYDEIDRTDYTRKSLDTGLIPMIDNKGKKYNYRMIVNVREDYLYEECLESCLTQDEIKKYGNGDDLYAWHIKKLEIFDKPKSLNDFICATQWEKTQDGKEFYVYNLSKAPATYQYVYLKGEK